MYFWRTKSLESDLINNAISHGERYKYLLAFLIINAVCIELAMYDAEPVSFVGLVESAGVILITILGTMYCFKANREGDDAGFIDRFICLHLSVFIRLLVLFVVSYVLYMILGYAVMGDAFDTYMESANWVEVIFVLCFELLFFRWLSSSIRRVAVARLAGNVAD